MTRRAIGIRRADISQQSSTATRSVGAGSRCAIRWQGTRRSVLKARGVRAHAIGAMTRLAVRVTRTRFPHFQSDVTHPGRSALERDQLSTCAQLAGAGRIARRDAFSAASRRILRPEARHADANGRAAVRVRRAVDRAPAALTAHEVRALNASIAITGSAIRLPFARLTHVVQRRGDRALWAIAVADDAAVAGTHVAALSRAGPGTRGLTREIAARDTNAIPAVAVVLRPA
jgi:hypothetical protein